MRAPDTRPEPGSSARADGAVVTWLKEQGAKADFCFLADRGIVGNGHMLMLEQNSDEIAGIILDWFEAAMIDIAE